MTVRNLLGLVVVLVVSSVCVRLGFWQVARLGQKRAMNAAMAAAMKEPPVEIDAVAREGQDTQGRRVRARGRYDETRQVLLSARSHAGSPGVEVVTPLMLAGDSDAVLVDRGWLYASDAATARPQDCPEPGEVSVSGMMEPMRHGAGGPSPRSLPSDTVALWSARWLDRDSLERRLPYAILPFVIRQLPGPGVPDRPVRSTPQPLDEFMHVSYAIQWFLFAAILLVGSALLARSQRRATAAVPIPGPPS